MAIVCPQRYNSSFAPHQTTHHVGIMHSSSKRYSQPTAGPSTPFIRGTTEGHIGPAILAIQIPSFPIPSENIRSWISASSGTSSIYVIIRGSLDLKRSAEAIGIFSKPSSSAEGFLYEEEAYKPFSASDDTEEERNEVRGRGGLVLLEEELYLFHNLEPYSYLKPQTWELNPLPLLLQAHLSSFLPLALLRGEQEHLYVVFLPDVGLPGSENTAMIISIIASFFSFFQNLGANAIATGASPVTSIFESFSGSIT
ncbi:hypothetical protein V6N12_020217 [Hibiscus sabdariffa]|uniref:Uncharacterized protein n=1 Tax=Hibiscus sabdariffa TaxID=183260 RepID=A0ABR2BN33_9ROSI